MSKSLPCHFFYYIVAILCLFTYLTIYVIYALPVLCLVETFVSDFHLSNIRILSCVLKMYTMNVYYYAYLF